MELSCPGCESLTITMIVANFYGVIFRTIGHALLPAINRFTLNMESRVKVVASTVTEHWSTYLSQPPHPLYQDERIASTVCFGCRYHRHHL